MNPQATTTTAHPYTGPVRVDLTPGPVTITVKFSTDDGTLEAVTTHADALTMRGAQREITTAMDGLGYNPAGRWYTTANGTARIYRPTP